MRKLFIVFIILIGCQLTKNETLEEIQDIDIKITRMDINDSNFSDLILLYGIVEIKANIDSIRISLDTTINKRKKESFIKL